MPGQEIEPGAAEDPVGVDGDHVLLARVVGRGLLPDESGFRGGNDSAASFPPGQCRSRLSVRRW